VKTLFLLSHPEEDAELHRVDHREYGRLLDTWGKFMEDRPMWSALMDAAARGDYDAVRKGLEARFE
jgi:hypothetical protein